MDFLLRHQFCNQGPRGFPFGDCFVVVVFFFSIFSNFCLAVVLFDCVFAWMDGWMDGLSRMGF